MKCWFVLLIAALCLGAASAGGAQIATGNIYGTVSDSQGGVLPGATVSVVAKSIGGAPRTTVTDSAGQFRFLNLDTATYTVTVELPGFTKQARDVIVNTGVNVQIPFSLSVGGLAETVVVTGASPVVDVKKAGTSTTLTATELQSTPQSKDPWAVLKTVPGVIVDRVNVGGNESGQQSGFAGKGSAFADTMWNLDGVVITDTTSGGASSSYYDFNAFDEVNVTTGGNDLRVQTGGIGINFVTRRGTNQFKGSVFTTYNGKSLESTNLPDVLKGDARLQGSDKANHTNQILERGFDIGGPIVKDKLWFWGSYGKNDIKIIRLTQTPDQTILTNTNAKINWSATKNDQVSGFYFNGAKEKFGRSPGAASNEADTFLWNQGNFYPDDGLLHPLHGLWKVEDNHVFGPNLFVNAKYAWYGWGYGFAPRGGTGLDASIDFDADTAKGSWFTYKATKPWHIVDVSGSAFASAGGANHEFKFGFGYVRRPNSSLTRWSGNEIVAQHQGPGVDNALLYRERNVNYLGQNYDAYVGDTISTGPITISVGIRWDRQQSENLASTAEANPAFPELLPKLVYDGSGTKIDWNNVSPRASVTYAMDSAKKTVARASYARYAGQLNPSQVTSASPVGTYYTYIAYKWSDLNHDGFAQKNEILTNLGPQYSNGVDPKNPGAVSASVNKIDTSYKANHDDEFIVGLDRELIPNLSISAAYTNHRSADLPGWNPRIGLVTADYTAGPVTTAGGFSGQAFRPNQAKVDASGSGRILTNRPDYRTNYQGLEISLNKRLSDKWFARVAFSTNTWTEHFDGPGSVQNPTRSDSTSGGILSGPQVQDGQVAPRSGGSGKGDIFYNAKWQLNANALYQLPAGFEVAGNVFGRQGYAQPYVLRLSAGTDGTVRVLGTPSIDQNRYPNLWDLDLRLAKTIKVYDRLRLQLSGDLFNVLNSDTTTAAGRFLGTTSFAQINEILSPRILRIGARLQF